ncbi:N-acetylmuramoyl-L-alanine amidase [Bacillus sp. Bva_UNVM-123]|uniref:N-acetylmuramoyl-L-alanine amidase n=1 Tax=Bacillus sp. Bva_UNVM-123 TaxID=2829798 RepID=UPI00391FB088
MRKKNLVFFIISILFLCLLFIVYKSDMKKPIFLLNAKQSDELKADSNHPELLEGKTIVIDAGHGGFDRGTVGLSYETIEKDLNLTVAHNIKQELEKRTRATVVLTREDDSNPGNNQKDSLQKRIELADASSADLFMSIHHDAFTDRDVKGITTHYSSHLKDNKKLAKIMQQSIFRQNIQTRDRGIKDSDFYILKNNSKPAILLELGFTSNEEDEIRMISEEFQTNSTKAIVDGVIEFFSE